MSVLNIAIKSVQVLTSWSSPAEEVERSLLKGLPLALVMAGEVDTAAEVLAIEDRSTIGADAI